MRQRRAQETATGASRGAIKDSDAGNRNSPFSDAGNNAACPGRASEATERTGKESAAIRGDSAMISDGSQEDSKAISDTTRRIRKGVRKTLHAGTKGRLTWAEIVQLRNRQV